MLFNLIHWNERDQELARFSGLTLSLFLFFAWVAFGYFYTVRVEVSFPVVMIFLGGVLFVLGALLYLKEIGQAREILWTLTICADATVLFGLIQQAHPALLKTDVGFYGLSAHSVFIHPNFFPTYLIFHIPIGVWLFLSEETKSLKTLAAVSFCLMLVGVGISGSPGGQITALVQVLAIGGYFRLRNQFSRLKTLAAWVLLSLAFYILWMCLLSKIWTPPGAPAGESHFSPAMRPWIFGDLMNRLVLWSGAWEIFKDRWLTGGGPWTFILLYGNYLSKVAFADLINIPRFTPPQAHNLFAQTASDTGAIGLWLLLACIFLFYSKTLSIVRDPNHPRRDAAFFLGASVGGYLAHNQIECNCADSVFTYIFALLVVLVDFFDREHAAARKPFNLGASRLFPALTIVCAVVGAVAIARFYLYEREISREIYKAQTVEELERHIAFAKDLCKRCDMPYQIAALVFMDQYKKTNDAKLLSKAETELRAASRVTAYASESPLYLAEIRTLQGRWREARKFYVEAMKYGSYTDSAAAGLKRVAELEKRDLGEVARYVHPPEPELRKILPPRR